MTNDTNNSIKCTVDTCTYHCKNRDYCSLPQIQVGCCCSNVTDCKGTECASFQPEAGM